MSEDPAQIVVNTLAVGEAEIAVERALEMLFPATVIEFREAELPEPIILAVFFLEVLPGHTKPSLVSRGEELAVEVERRLLAELRQISPEKR